MERYELESGNILEVWQEEYPQSPREMWENLGTMICFHKRYILGDKHNFTSDEFGGWGDMKKKLSRKLNAAIILPLYMYDHSGLTISTTPFSCPWDSGQIGYILVSKENIRKSYLKKRISKKTLEIATKNLLAEVETYDQYLRGDVYGFTLKDPNGNEIETVGGFYGADPEKNGMLDGDKIKKK
jgi:hypothetical protein